MELYEWSNDYAIGNAEIDCQHRQLFKIISHLHKDIQNNKIKTSLSSFFLELVHYTEYHFSSEEYLMEICNFPEIEEHKLKHKKFINSINEEITNTNGNNISTGIKLLVFLNNWLVEHIRTTDRELGKFLEKQDI